MTAPYQAYQNLIDMYDNHVLVPLVSLKDRVRCPTEKQFWVREINEALDDRLGLMAKRDSFKTLIPNDLEKG